MCRPVTRFLGVAVLALAALTASVRSSPAMACIPAGSLGFTWFDWSSASAPVVVYLSPEDLSLIGSGGTIGHTGSGGGSDILDDGTIFNDFEEIFTACPVEKITDWSPVGAGGSAIRTNYTDRLFEPYSLSGPVRAGIQTVLADGTVHRYAAFTIIGSGGNPTIIQEAVAGPAIDVAYYKVVPSGATATQQKTVYRYDLVNDVDLGAWVSEATRELRQGQNLLVLRDGTVLVGWSGDFATSSVVKHYAADGTLLHTYTIVASASNETLNLVAARDDTTFWVAYGGSGFFGTLDEIRVSDGAVLHHHEVTFAQVSAVESAFGNTIDWQPSLGAFFITRQDCDCAMDYVIMEIRGAKKHGYTNDPRYRFFSLQGDGDDLVIKIPEALHAAPTKVVYRVKHGLSQRFTRVDSRSKFEMRGQVSSIDPTTLLSKDDAWVELRINDRVYANGDDYDLIDPNSPITGCKNAVTGLNTHNEYGWSIGMWQNEFLDCCYLDRNAAYCRPPLHQGPPTGDEVNDGELGPCPPPGPGGSSFDGAADGDRYVAPGGFPATYVQPTGEGTVATAADPVDHQDLSTLRTPLVSIDLTVCDGTLYRLAKSPLPQSGRAPADARVTRFGAIPYPFSNRFGSLAPQTWEVEIADEDGKFRALLASGPNRFYKRWTADAFLEDDDARLRNATRQRVARGRCITVLTGDQDQSLVLKFSDEYSRHDSAFSLDRPLPVALIGDIFQGGATSPDLPSVPHAADDIAAKAATIIGGEGSDEYRINDGVTPIGIIPLRLVGQVNLGGQLWDAYFVNLLADYSIPALFGSNLDPDCPASVRLDPALYDGSGTTQFLVPGYSPWDGYFANKYIEITWGDKTYWVTMIFGQGPVSLQHVLQKVPLSCNVNGIPENGDGTGALVDDASRLLVRLLDIILTGQTSGAWGPISAYADGIAKIRTSDFEAIKVIHDQRLSTRYRGAVIIDSQRAARDWLGDILQSFDIRLLINHHGQIGAAILDDKSSLANLTTYTDLHHIIEKTFRITSELSAELENSLTYDAGPEPASGRLTVGKSTARGEQSIQDWGEGEEYLAQPLTFVGLHRADVAGNVAAHRIAWTQNGITRGEFQIDLAGGALRGGQIIRVTHQAGIGQTGWRRRVLQTTDRVLMIDDEEFRSRVNWEDAHPILVKTLTGAETLHHDPDAGEDEPRVGFKPIGSEVAGTGWTIGSEVAGTAYRAG
jgi:hypothetical protein